LVGSFCRNNPIFTTIFIYWHFFDWNFLNKLKKQPDKSSFYYWNLTENYYA
jgi:hypothetical protein